MEIINNFFLSILNYKDYVHNKEIIKILKAYSSKKEGLNFILYGSDGIGKKSILKTYMKELYGDIRLNYIEFEYKYKSRLNTFKYSSNKHVKVIDLRLVKHQLFIIDLLLENYKLKTFEIIELPRYIFILHCEWMNDKLMSSLRPVIEKLNQRNIYIGLITNKIQHIKSPILSRMLLLKLKQIDSKQFSDILKYYNIKLTKYYEKKLYNEYNPNIKKMLLNGLNYSLLNKKIEVDNLDKEIKEIYRLVKELNKMKDINKINKITEILYKIIKKDKHIQFLEELLEFILEKETNENKQQYYIELLSETELNIKESTNPIYGLQYLIFKLIEIF